MPPMTNSAAKSLAAPAGKRIGALLSALPFLDFVKRASLGWRKRHAGTVEAAVGRRAAVLPRPSRSQPDPIARGPRQGAPARQLRQLPRALARPAGRLQRA